MEVVSLVLGLCGLVAWIVPLFGFPITIVGLTLGVIGQRREKKGLALAGLILSVIGLVATTANAAIGAYQGAIGEHWLQQHL